MTDIIKQSFNINLTTLRILGFYPPNKHSCIYTIRSVLIYFITLILTPFLIALRLFLDDMEISQKLIFNAAYVVQIGLFSIKLLYFITRSDKIKTCIHYFGNDYFSARNSKEEKIINECINDCRRNSTMFFIGVSAMIMLWFFRPIFWYTFTLPFDIWLPVAIDKDPKIFWCFYIFSLLVCTIAGLAGTLLDPLISGLAFQAAGQLKILKYNFKHLGENGENIFLQIKRCTQLHNAIVRFVYLYEECFSLAIFTQIASSVIIICFMILPLVMMEVTSDITMMSVAGTLISMGEPFFYCYYGTILYEESSSINEAIYLGKWYQYDIKSKKALLILMERSQRPMEITAGKLMNISLNTFTTILRRSYSLVAVFKRYQ